jgi:hypothetical protein
VNTFGAMRTGLVSVVLAGVACTGPSSLPLDARLEIDGGPLEADGGKSGADGGPLDGTVDPPDGMSCTSALVLETAVIRAESTRRLRMFFGEAEGLDGGRLYYRDGVSSVNSCPIYDQSALIYSVQIPERLMPAELVGKLDGASPRANYVWGLNGHGYIYYSNDRFLQPETPTDPDISWGNDRFPIVACRLFADQAGEAARTALVGELTALAAPLPVTYLEAVGVFCWGPGTDDPASVELSGEDHELWVRANAVAERVRESTLFDSASEIEWSPVVYGFEMFLDDPVAVEGETVSPECLRSTSASYRAQPLTQVFASLPSFPTPYAAGWVPNPDAERCTGAL